MPNTKERKIVSEPSPTGEVLYNPTTGEPISTGVTPTGTATGGTNQPYSVITGNGATPSTAQPPANNPTPITTPSSGSAGGMSAKSYAQWLYSQSLNLASEQRKQVVDASEITRKRSIADANSSYMKSLSTYGQNAEKMASMGLSGSGYGEYLTSQAYAQKRSTVQNANALHLKTEKEAIYQEKVAKQEALSTYHANMLQAQAEQNNAYNSLLSAASSGSSIESIMASGQWGLLSADQQTQIKNIAQSNSFKLRIDGGESIEDIMADAKYNTLSADVQQSLQNYYQTKQKNDANAAATSYTNFINMLRSGTSLASIRGMTGFELMTPDQIAEFESIEAYNTANAQLLGGKPLDEIKADTELWSKLSTKDAAKLERDAKTIASEDSAAGVQYDSYVNRTINDLKSGNVTLAKVMEDTLYQNGTATGALSAADIKMIQDAADYHDLTVEIEDGMTLDNLEKDERYTALSHNDQSALKNLLKDKKKEDSSDSLKQLQSYVNSNKDLTMEDIQTKYPDLYNKLTPDDLTTLGNDITTAENAKATEEWNAYVALEELVYQGYSLTDLQSHPLYSTAIANQGYFDKLQEAERDYKAAKSDATYDKLWKMFDGSQESFDRIQNNALWKDLDDTDREAFESAVNDEIAQTRKKEAFTNIDLMIQDNAFWSEIEASEDYALLDEKEKAVAKNAHDTMVKSVFDAFMEDAETNGIGHADDPRYELLSDTQKNELDQAIKDFHYLNAVSSYGALLEAVDSNIEWDLIKVSPNYKSSGKATQNKVKEAYKKKHRDEILENIEYGAYKTFEDLRNSANYDELWDDDDKEKFENALTTYLFKDPVYGGAKSVQELENAASAAGFKRSEIDKMIGAWSSANLDRAISNGIKMTLGEAEDMVNKGYLPEGSVEKLQRNDLIDTSYSSTKNLYEAYINGDIDTDTLLKESNSENQAIGYGEGNIPKIKVTGFDNGYMEAFDVSVGGRSYNVYSHNNVKDDKTIKELNRIATGDKNKTPKHGVRSPYSQDGLVVYNGRIYVFVLESGNSHWQIVEDSRDNKDLLAALIANQK